MNIVITSLLLLAWTQLLSAVCPPSNETYLPEPYKTAALDWFAGTSTSAVPKAYVLSNCNPPEPQGIEKQHVLYRNWLKVRTCDRDLVTNLDQLAIVSSKNESSDEMKHQSLRAEPAVVSVEFGSLDEILSSVSHALWPDQSRRLIAELQTVSIYRADDVFDAYISECHEQGQEGVLVIDLGLRTKNYDNRDEMFIHGLPVEATVTNQTIPTTAGPLVGSWHASQAGDWVSFPMHRVHGVYPRVSDRVVAVFTLIDPTLTYKPLCDLYRGSCLMFDCRPGFLCLKA